MVLRIRKTVIVRLHWIAAVVLLSVVPALCFTRCGTGRNHSEIVPLKVSDGALCDGQGKKVQLRGVSTHGIAWYGEYLNAGAMQSVRDAGGNVIRIAMYTAGEEGYVLDPEMNLERVFSGIEDAAAAGLYVIVDWHILQDGDPNEHLAEAITFFDAVASGYGDLPNILYEICNEPSGVSWDSIKEYAHAVIPVIRRYDADAVILLGMPDYSTQLSYGWIDPFPDDNLLYTFHYYAGEHRNFGMLKEAVERGIPVFVSEWGVGEEGIGDGEAFADYLWENGISWCAWSLCNKDEPYSLIRSDVTELGGWKSDDLTECGRMIFKELGRKR